MSLTTASAKTAAKSSNSESFAQLFEETFSKGLKPGEIVKGRVHSIEKDYVLVSVGLKSEGPIPIEQFKNLKGELQVQVGDEVDVMIEEIDDGFGDTRLSREKAKRAAAWRDLEVKHKANQNIIGVITSRVKGGFTVEIEGLRAFLPGSLVDVRPIRDTAHLENREIEFKVIKMDIKRNNIVVSRRAVMESDATDQRTTMVENLQEGQVVSGVVKNLTDYGAFVDLGGVDGLLHITDMSWRRVNHPGAVLKVGDELEVVILKIDRQKGRVSLGMKQLGNDPWSEITKRFPAGQRLRGTVTNLTDYGCFVELADGIEGLVHMSEMDWTNKNIHPSKVVQLGSEVDVIVLEIDEERRRISLGMKQCTPNPWVEFSEHHKQGEHVKGAIRSITDFGIFIGLEGNIDGLVHLSDISWHDAGEVAIRQYKKGQEVEAVILAIDPERERISLGIKQLNQDVFTTYTETNPKGEMVKGRVTEALEDHYVLELAAGVHGALPKSEVTEGAEFAVGDEVEARIIEVDHKDRVINLSQTAEVKVKAAKPKAVKKEKPQNGTFGDLLKAKLDQGQDDAD